MRVLALDLSLNSTGVAFKNTKKKKIIHGLIKPPKDLKDQTDKIACTRSDVIKWCKKYKVNRVYMEELSFGSRGAAVHVLAKLHGVIQHTLRKRGIKWSTIPPTTVKKFVVGKGNAKKSMVMKALYKHFSIDVDQEDEADAIGVLLTGIGVGG